MRIVGDPRGHRARFDGEVVRPCLLATVLSGYAPGVSALEPVLYDLPPRIIGIDGREGVGKTSFGRYLAWHFNVTLIETDLFANDGSVLLGYRLDELNRLIQLRLDRPRPVIIEGVALIRLLEHLRRRADFLLYCEAVDYDPDESLASWLDEYAREYAPKARANLVIQLDWRGI